MIKNVNREEISKMFGRVNDEGYVMVHHHDDAGLPVTTLDVDGLWPVGSSLCSRCQHPEGIVISMEQARELGLKIERIRYVTGDIFGGLSGDKRRLLVHVCNDIGAWGGGFVLAISKHWEEPESRYRKFSKEPSFGLGEVQFVSVEDNVHVANMVAQEGCGYVDGVPPIRYEKLRECFCRVRGMVLSEGVDEVVMPRIGCGLAGGQWSEIEPIIIEELCNYGIKVAVYTLPGDNSWR